MIMNNYDLIKFFSNYIFNFYEFYACFRNF